MSIGFRLTIAFVSVALIIICGTAIAGWEFSRILQQTRMLSAVDDKLMAVYRVRADVGAIRRQLEDVSRTQNSSKFLAATRFQRNSLSKDIARALEYFRDSRARVPGTLSALRETIDDQLDSMQRLAEVGDWPAIQLRLDNQVDGILESVREMVERVNLDVSEQRTSSLNEIETGQQSAQRILGLTALISLVIALTLGLHVTRSIVRPLKELKSVANQFAAVDFTVTIHHPLWDELGEVTDAFVAAGQKLHHNYAELKRSNEALEQFAYAASHDLQEPLRTMSIYSELLKRRHSESLSPQAKQYLSHVTDASAHMRELVGGILEYSRLTIAEVEPQEEIAAKEIVATVLGNLHAMVEENRAVIEYEALPQVVGSRPQLVQLFQNLISNAIKYRREEEAPRIRISARDQGAMWRFCVEDNGIGIDAQHYAQVFGMFKQLNRGARGGVGLGLAISKQIVERHGGELSIASDVMHGTCFYFTLRKANMFSARDRKEMAELQKREPPRPRRHSGILF